MPRGFTLIELMITISIIAIISAIGLASYSQAQKLARDAKRKQDLRQVATALELYHQKNKRFPCTDGWVQSSDSPPFWLVERSTGFCASFTPVNLDKNYINTMPHDPLKDDGNPSTGSNYGYGFRDGNGCTVGAGNYYLLATRLENASDPDRNEIKQYKYCDGNNLADPTSQKNLFVITSK
ncbi:prepilin-type N-terminal cleavage/methylation domain-containing protein [Candidatus Daviesbacteria bacterium]|nr:prepilin-type N-terminal cleavage/methylation domain-containing protein [Candidatus Daviesbacteria bacterium]